MMASSRGRGRVTPGSQPIGEKSGGTYLLGAYVLAADGSYLLVMN